MIKNTGFDPLKEKNDRTETDWIFGASSITGLADNIECKKYLPQGELQNIGEDKMDCASRSPINILETQFNYLIKEKILSEENINWLNEKGYIENGNVIFSDRFIAIKSGTTLIGNSIKAPLDAIRKCGLIPKKMFPQVLTIKEYLDLLAVSLEMEKLGDEFLKRFQINYDIVYAKEYKEIIRKNMLATAGFAWSEPLNGIYPATDKTLNHAFCVFPPTQYEAFDNYFDEGREDDFIKLLAPDYVLLPYSYRLIVNEKIKIMEEQITILQKIVALYQKVIALFMQKKELPITPQPETPVIDYVPPTPEPENKPKPYLWDTPANVRHSCRVIMDEYNLTWKEKDLLCDICGCESGFNPMAKFLNNPKSIDRGLFQINSYWHPSITDEQAYNPEFAARWAIQALKDWKVKTYWPASAKCWNKDHKYDIYLT